MVGSPQSATTAAGRQRPTARTRPALAYTAIVVMGVAAGSAAVELLMRQAPALAPAEATRLAATPFEPPPLEAMRRDAGPAGAEDVQRLAVGLARSTLLALDQALRTGEFAVFRALAGADFQRANAIEELARIFVGVKRLDLTGGEPVVFGAPEITAFRLAFRAHVGDGGRGASVALAYVAENGEWRLDEISIGPRTP